MEPDRGGSVASTRTADGGAVTLHPRHHDRKPGDQFRDKSLRREYAEARMRRATLDHGDRTEFARPCSGRRSTERGERPRDPLRGSCRVETHLEAPGTPAQSGPTRPESAVHRACPDGTGKEDPHGHPVGPIRRHGALRGAARQDGTAGLPLVVGGGCGRELPSSHPLGAPPTKLKVR